MVTSTFRFSDEAVAVVGAACRFPGAHNLDELWDLMISKRSCAEEVQNRPTRVPFPSSFRASADPKVTSKLKLFGNFIDDEHVAGFDHSFFGFSSKEAQNMDPQQRMLHELTYEALESSGYLGQRGAHRLPQRGDRVGCFVGVVADFTEHTSGYPSTAYTAIGTLRAFHCGRLSHHFGWTGPAESIDTACSASMVAVHRACQALWAGECHTAVAAGVNILNGVNLWLDLQKAGFLSPSGQCKPFDADADGYCRADGAGVVVLKPLAEARANGDPIFAIIPSAGTNQSGLSASLTVPHAPAHVDLYRRLLERAGLEPRHISYVECHGTGTQAGDPVEISGLTEVFGGAAAEARDGPLYIGSIKGNLGHCEPTAGIAGLMKVIAMLQHAEIPPQASFNTLNPRIPEMGPLAIPTEVTPWKLHPDAGPPFRAAVINSYGAAGSNASLICCGDPTLSTRIPRTPATAIAEANHGALPCLTTVPIIVTAATEMSLSANCMALAAYLRREAAGAPNFSVPDVAFTLSERRARHRFRFCAPVSASEPCGDDHTGKDGLVELASIIEQAGMSKPEHQQFHAADAKKKPAVVLAFGGQSKKAVFLDEHLYSTTPVLRRHLEECNSLLVELGHSAILPGILLRDSADPIHHQQDVVFLQTATFAIQYSLARCWVDAGVQVAAAVGHSFGELTALAFSGVLSLRDGLRAVAGRALLIQTAWGVEGGKMLAVQARWPEIQKVLDAVAGLEVACFNAADGYVLVGSACEVDSAETLLKTSNTRTQRVGTTHGFHSRFTEPVLPGLAHLEESLTYHPPRTPLELCCSPDTTITAPLAVQGHLGRHIRQPVFFTQAVERITRRLASSGHSKIVWLEAGTDSPIIAMAKRAVGHLDTDSDLHSFFPITTEKSNTGALAAPSSSPKNTTLCSTTLGLWRNGVELSFLPWISSPGGRDEELHHYPKQIALPSYQYSRSPMWKDYVDHTLQFRVQAVEAEKSLLAAQKAHALEIKNLVRETGAVVSNCPLPPAAETLVIRRSSGNDGVHTFVVNVVCRRFREIMTAHAVRGRELCPASLYMECAAMVLQIVTGDANDFPGPGMALNFRDLHFGSPFRPKGEEEDREVAIVLSPTDQHPASGSGGKAWNYTFQSTSPSDKSRTIHSTGTLSISPWLDDTRLIRALVADRVRDIKAQPEAEHLSTRRVYMGFEKVVDYAPTMQGIRSLLIHENWTVGTVAAPEVRASADASSVLNAADCALTDSFIQICGFSINTSELCLPGYSCVATGISSCTFSSSSPLQRQGASWTVLGRFQQSEDNRNTVEGDIFVVDNQTDLLMGMCTAVSFTKMKNKTLENLLDKAAPEKRGGGPNSTNQTTKSIVPAENLQSTSTSGLAAKTSYPMTPETPQSDTPPKMTDSSSTVDTSMLWEMLSEYTGIPAAQLASTAERLEDMGIDSLALVELSDELEARFGISLDAHQLLSSSPQSLRTQLAQDHDSRSTPAESPSAAVTPSSRQDYVPLHGVGNGGVTLPDNVRQGPKQSPQSIQTRQTLFRLISEATGVAEGSISGQTTLDELGIDSLGVVELVDELEEAFHITTDAHEVSGLTITELLFKCNGHDEQSESQLGSHFTENKGHAVNDHENNKSVDTRLLPQSEPAKLRPKRATVVYKDVGALKIHAEIFLPSSTRPSQSKPMPVALIIHGGGHMALSRTCVPSNTIMSLLEAGVLPVSVDYRLCPEINLVEGALTDVRDAYKWIRDGGLQSVLQPWGIQVDVARVAAIGWSSGGQLALSLGWQREVPPPAAVLAFYAPLDWANANAPAAAPRPTHGDDCRAATVQMSDSQLAGIADRLPRQVRTTYDDIIRHHDFLGLGWVTPDDPRSQLVGALIGHITSPVGLPLIINGIQQTGGSVDPATVASVCPMTHVKAGRYATPTFLIQGTDDEIVPHSSAVEFVAALRGQRVPCGLLAPVGAKHCYDLSLRQGSEQWRSDVAPALDFLFEFLF